MLSTRNSDRSQQDDNNQQGCADCCNRRMHLQSRTAASRKDAVRAKHTLAHMTKTPRRSPATKKFKRWNTFCVVHPYSGTRIWMRTNCTAATRAIAPYPTARPYLHVITRNELKKSLCTDSYNCCAPWADWVSVDDYRHPFQKCSGR